MRPEGEWFEPDSLVELYRRYLLVVNVLLFLPAVAFAAVVGSPVVAAAVAAVAVGLDAFLLWWISKFDATARFRLSAEEVEYSRGVWWRKHTTVPYTRITNVESSQGPVQRSVGTGKVRLQTAGTGQQQPELSLVGLADYESVKDQLLDLLREREPEARLRRATGSGATGSAESGGTRERDGDLLAEVRRIRELLEESG